MVTSISRELIEAQEDINYFFDAMESVLSVVHLRRRTAIRDFMEKYTIAVVTALIVLSGVVGSSYVRATGTAQRVSSRKLESQKQKSKGETQ